MFFSGAWEDGLGNRSVNSVAPLAIKAVIDGLAAMSFARMFGARILAAAVPMLAFEGAIAFGASQAQPWLQQHGAIDSIHVVCGFLTVYVSLIVFEVKKVELGDYLPAIPVAATLAAWLR